MSSTSDCSLCDRLVKCGTGTTTAAPYEVKNLDTPADDVVLVTSKDTILTPELAHILSSIYFLPKFGDSEDSVPSLVDAMVLRPMKLVGDGANCPFQVNRNGADSTGATMRYL